ncbi:GNAT family N-acetyltransferase [Paracoccus sp. SSK6]|uniref:GNAT family N-acetyltransferase n=1 Tax=Paracoccus sp. SSK6 TaxID=3143131 RepID=UPI00321B0280
MQITTPIPDRHLRDAARMWWGAFAPFAAGRAPPIRPCHGIAAIRSDGRLAGVAGFRDHHGGLLAEMPLLARLLFRPAPETLDLVIDGIVVDGPRRGTGRALLEAASDVARRAGRPGLRAEVALRNRPAMAFHAATGFAEIGRGPYGWPWTGPVAILRRPV